MSIEQASSKLGFSILAYKVIYSLAFLIAFSATVFFLFESLNNHDQIKKVYIQQSADIIFRSLYSAMEVGANKEQLHALTSNLSAHNDNLFIQIVRGNSLIKEYGNTEESRFLRSSNPDVQQSLMFGESHFSDHGNKQAYVYPVKFSAQCQHCHTFEKPGEIAGAVYVQFIGNQDHKINYLLPLIVSVLSVLCVLVYCALYLRIKNNTE